MKWYEDFDLTEVIAVLVLGWIATVAAWKGDLTIANTVAAGLVGYMVKTARNGLSTKNKDDSDKNDVVNP